MSNLYPVDPTHIDQFLVVGRLGSGGFGTVYKAKTPDGDFVAIKVLRPELADSQILRDRLAREGLAIRRVRGERTVRVLDVVTVGPVPYLVMELLEGLDLEKTIVNSGPIGGPMLWFVAEGLVQALREIHEAGIVHRDFKPSNVIFGPEGIKVLDFGVSAVADHTSLTQTGAFIGTAAWISPEQVLSGDVGAESDVFNLGLVLAYVATGQHPYGSGRADAVMYRICNAEPNTGGVSEPIGELVRACLVRQPEDRPTIKQIEAFLASGGETWDSEDSDQSNRLIDLPVEEIGDEALDDVIASGDGAVDSQRTRIIQRRQQVQSEDLPIDDESLGKRSRRNLILVVSVIALVAVAASIFALTRPSDTTSNSNEVSSSSLEEEPTTTLRSDKPPSTVQASSSIVTSSSPTQFGAAPTTVTKNASTGTANRPSSATSPITTPATTSVSNADPLPPIVTNLEISKSHSVFYNMYYVSGRSVTFTASILNDEQAVNDDGLNYGGLPRLFRKNRPGWGFPYEFQRVRPGIWTLTVSGAADFFDVGLNEFCVTFTQGVCSGPAVSFEVLNEADPPTISNFNISPAIVYGGSTVKVNARIVDATGVTRVFMIFEIKRPDGLTSGGGCGEISLISGDERDGIWSTDCRLPAPSVGQAVIRIFSHNPYSEVGGYAVFEYRVEVLPLDGPPLQG